MTGKIIGRFKKLGYKYTKDPLGHYFDKNGTRMSIMISGPVWNCYFNRIINDEFQLVDKQMNLLDDDFVYKWMLLHVV